MRTYPIVVDEEGYETSTIGLHFKVRTYGVVLSVEILFKT